jgi:hypothetical protein
MSRLVSLAILCVFFALATSITGCIGGGGGGGGGGAARPGAEKLADWVGLWSDDAARGQRRPPNFEIPAPPEVTLPSIASQIGDDVSRAEPPLAELRARVWNETTQQAAEYTQGALCEWFGWYVEDPANRPVPSTEQFLFLFASGALKVELATPVEKEISDAVELFRDAIERGQNLAEDARFAAMAAACSIPVGG